MPATAMPERRKVWTPDSGIPPPPGFETWKPDSGIPPPPGFGADGTRLQATEAVRPVTWDDFPVVQAAGDPLARRNEVNWYDDIPGERPAGSALADDWYKDIPGELPNADPWAQFPVVSDNPTAKYDTPLSPDEEGQFQTWKAQNAPRDSGVDYDLRGAFKAGLKPAENGHWPDTFKKPNHPTFSNESKYAVGEDAAKAGRWEGEQFISPEKTQERLTAMWNLAVDPPHLPMDDPRIVGERTGKYDEPYLRTGVDNHPIHFTELKKQYEQATGEAWGPQQAEEYTKLRDLLQYAYDYTTGEPGRLLSATPAEKRDDVLKVVQLLATQGKYNTRGFGKQLAASPLRGLAAGPEALYRYKMADADDATWTRQTEDVLRKAQEGDYSWYDPRGWALAGGEMSGPLAAIGIASAFGGPAGGLTATGATFGTQMYGDVGQATGSETKALAAGALGTLIPGAGKYATKIPGVGKLLTKAGSKIVGTVGERLGEYGIHAGQTAAEMATLGGSQAALSGGTPEEIAAQALHSGAGGFVAGMALGLPRAILRRTPSGNGDTAGKSILKTTTLPDADSFWRDSGDAATKIIDTTGTVSRKVWRDAGLPDGTSKAQRQEFRGQLRAAKAAAEVDLGVEPEAPQTPAQPPSEFAQRANTAIESVPALKGSKVNVDDEAKTATVALPGGRETTVHFDADEAMDQIEAKRRADGNAKEGDKYGGFYAYQRNEAPEANSGHIYLRSEASPDVISHEAAHWLEDIGVVTADEISQHGGSEAFADAYMKWASGGQKESNGVFSRVWDFLKGLVGVREKKSIFKELEERTKPEVQDAQPTQETSPVGDNIAQPAVVAEERQAGGQQPPPTATVTPPPLPAGKPGRSVKNAYTEAKRLELGLPDRAPVVPEKAQEWLDAAAAKSEPEIDALLTDLRANKRVADPVEHAMLLRRQNDLENAHEAAVAVGDATAATSFERQLADVFDVEEKTGTAWGRSGVSRQIEINNDYSLRGLTRRLLKAKGDTLTPEERVKLQEQAATIAEFLGKIDTYEQRQAEEALDRELAAVQEEVTQKRNETLKEKIRKQFQVAKDYGLNADDLEAAATERVKATAQEATEYNKALRDLVKRTGLTPSVIRKIENGKGNLAEYNGLDAKAGALAREYPQLGFEVEPADAPQTKDYAQQIVEKVKAGPKAVPEWHEKLVEVAGELAREKKADVQRDMGDAWEAAEGGFGESSGFPWEETTAGTKPVVRSPRTVRTKKALDDAWASFKQVATANKFYSGVDPAALVEAAKLTKAAIDHGISTFSDFMVNATRNIGAGAAKMRDTFEKAWEDWRAAGAIQTPTLDDPGAIRRLAQRLTRNHADMGMIDREKVVDAVHAELGQIVPNITRRQTADAMAGYGDFKELKKDPTSVKVREWRGELQQLAKLEDMSQGTAPKKTGVERREPSDEERRLIQQVNEAKKKGGFTVTDPARQLKSALDAAKTAVRNRIADMEKEIRDREKIVKTRTDLTPDTELTDLRGKRDALQKDWDAVFPRKRSIRKMTEAQRLASMGRALDRAIEGMQADIDAGRLGPKEKGARLTSPTLEAKRAALEYLTAQRDELRKVDPKYKATMEVRQTAAYKRALTKRIADVKSKIARDDVSKRPITKTVLDREAMALQGEMAKVKAEFQKMEDKARLGQRNAMEKTMDTMGKWRRAGVLSYPTTLAKLVAAAVTRFATTPIEEAAGGILSNLPLVSRVAARAPTEGGANFGAVGRAIAKGITSGVRDSLTTLKTGESDISRLYAKRPSTARSVLDFCGEIHAALKAPVKRMGWELGFEKRMEWNARQGVDVSDPIEQLRIAKEAYEDGNRAIFMQDNWVANKVRGFFAATSDPQTGHATLGKKAWELSGKVFVPIVKVPTNIVAETFQYAFGSVTGSVRLAGALAKGIDNLKPNEADLIMRSLKKGSLGGAALLAGFMMPNNFGGYYERGEKRKKGEVKFGGARVCGVEVPSMLLHNPLLNVFQLGATMRRVADSEVRAAGATTQRGRPVLKEKQGLTAGVLAGLLGMIEEVPFLRETTEMAKAFDPKTRASFFGELSKSVTVPGGVQWLAGKMDRTPEGEKITRKPSSILQHVATGIPILRKQVPPSDQSPAKRSLLRQGR
jgi:hypothetical protein